MIEGGQIIRNQFIKNWETLLAHLLQTKVSCKAAEIAATRSLNVQLFFVWHATYNAFYKKNPTYWDYYIMTISLTWIIAHLINIHVAGQTNWPLLSFLLLYWIAGIGIGFHCKHNLIHSYIQSLNPILKVLKFKYLQIQHKACLSPFLVTNRPLALRGHVTNASFKQWVGILLMPKIDRANKNYYTLEIWEEMHLKITSPMIVRHARDFTWNRGDSSNSPPTGRLW